MFTEVKAVRSNAFYRTGLLKNHRSGGRVERATMLMALCICIYKDRRVTKGKGSQTNSCRVRSERGNSGSSGNGLPLGQASGVGEDEGRGERRRII